MEQPIDEDINPGMVIGCQAIAGAGRDARCHSRVPWVDGAAHNGPTSISFLDLNFILTEYNS